MTTSLLLLQRMAENNAWSNARLYEACAKLSPEAFAAKRTSFFPSLPETLNHILTVDWYYVDALEEGGRGRTVFDVEIPFPDLAPLAEAQRVSDQKLIAFTRSLTERDIDREVRIERPDHVQVETVVDTLLHLFVHQIHHRGQAHAMLAGTAVSPPQLDEFFMRGDLPLRESELRALGLPIR
jgi:uncharacterized damage-inducible protein DinB